MEQTVLTIAECASLLGVARNTAYSLAARGVIPTDEVTPG